MIATEQRMAITLESTRLGRREIDPGDVVEFPRGIIGLDSHRWAVIPHDQDGAFAWLHSVEDGALALPVTDPRRFFPGFELVIGDEDRDVLGLSEDSQPQILVTVRARASTREFTANLRAPILIHRGIGHQVINLDEAAPLQAPLFGDGGETGGSGPA
jgi:flagellar assembly factor FliW